MEYFLCSFYVLFLAVTMVSLENHIINDNDQKQFGKVQYSCFEIVSSFFIKMLAH